MDDNIKVQWAMSERYYNLDEKKSRLLTEVIRDRKTSSLHMISDNSVEDAEITFEILNPKLPTIILGTIQSINRFRQYQAKSKKMFIPGYWAFDNVDMRHLVSNTSPTVLIHETDFKFIPYGLMMDHGSISFEGSRWPYFVRPDSSKKTFAGQVIRSWSDEKDFSKTYSIPNADMIFVAPEKKIFREARCIIADKELASINLYHNQFNNYDFINNISSAEGSYEFAAGLHLKELRSFVTNLLQSNNVKYYIPDDVFVMDVGSFHDPDFQVDITGIIEYNSFNSSGLYIDNYADMTDMVMHVEAVAKKHYWDVWGDYDGA